MVKIALQLKAFLENVTGLLADGEDFRYDNETHNCRNCILDCRWYLYVSIYYVSIDGI